MPVRSILGIIFLFLACSKPQAESLSAQEIKSGQVDIKITPSAKSLRTCDLLELSAEITYPQDFKIKLPDSKSDFGDFLVYQINQNSAVSINEEQNRIYQIIILEPGLPAQHKLPALKFTYWNAENQEISVKSRPMVFDVLSSIGPRNKEIEDIITKTEKTGHTVTIVGSSALFLTLFYFIFICKPEEKQDSDPSAEALKNFSHLKTLNEDDLINEMPAAASLFLKEKLNLPTAVKNLDVVIREISLKKGFRSLSEKLNELLSEYNKLRFSSEKANKEALLRLHSSFESVFTEIQK